jgi:hypothetical protein
MSLLLISLIAGAVAMTTPFVKVEKSTFATHAKVEGWRDVGDAERRAELHSLTVALKLRNVDRVGARIGAD